MIIVSGHGFIFITTIKYIVNNVELYYEISIMLAVLKGAIIMDEPKVQMRAEQPYVSIRIEVDLKEWKKANALVVEIFEWLEQKRIQPAGAPFFRYQEIKDMDKNKMFNLEVGVPVGNAIPGDGRVVAGVIPAGRYVTLTHTGHPDCIVKSFAILEGWAKSHDIEWNNVVKDSKEIWGGRFEYYLTDPADQPNPEKWSIEIEYLIKERSPVEQ